MIYCSKGDSYRVGHVTTDASDSQIGFHIFFALNAILSSIGYNLQIRPILQSAIPLLDQDSSEESPDFTDVTS